MNEDIIVAIATSRLEAAISMIRVSGPDCIAFVQKFFTGKIIEKPSHTINYGYIIDDGLLSLFLSKWQASREQ